MSVETDGTYTDGTEDSAVIRELRDKVKELNKKLASQGEAIRSEVAREQIANSLMPAQYKGLTQYMLQEVDGDLDAAKVQAWLAERVGTAAPEPEIDVDSVADVATTASASASAQHSQPTPAVDQRLRELEENSGTMDLFEYNRQIEAILNSA